MTVRKLQKTGGASLSIIIPKKWAANLELTDKSQLEIDSSNPTLLKLRPVGLKMADAVVVIKGKNSGTNKLIRETIAAYLAGADQVIIDDLALNPKQTQRLHQLCASLIGFEIVEQSSSKIVLQNVFDSSKFPITKNIEKMFLMVKNMFDDTILAISTHDLNLGQSVVKREQEIDKFHLAVTRQLYVHLHDDSPEDLTGLTILDMYYFGLISRQIERIADHCVKICSLIGSVDPKTLAALSTQTAEISKTIDLAQQMVKNIDREAAHAILDKCTHLAKKIREELHGLTGDSLDRICGYLTNMAEATLDQISIA